MIAKKLLTKEIQKKNISVWRHDNGYNSTKEKKKRITHIRINHNATVYHMYSAHTGIKQVEC